MGFIDVVKILSLPALSALAIYLILAYVVIPLHRANRARYAQYLPLENARRRAWSLFDRGRGSRGRGDFLSDDDDEGFADEEGESMVGFDVGRRTEGRDGRGGGGLGDASDGRLSRDLEEGFRDDSSEEGDDRRGQGRGWR